MDSPTLSQEQIMAAATNSPALSSEQFQLGDAIYKVVHLPYDDYVEFIAHLQPFMDALAEKIASSAGVSVPGLHLTEPVSSSLLLKFCGNSLPELVRIIVKQTRPDITAEQVKEQGKNPFVLAAIVLKQVAYNGMIRDFASFFAQIVPLLKGATEK